MNGHFPLPLVWDGLELEMFLNDMVLESSVITIGDTGPRLLSSQLFLALMLTSASGSQGRFQHSV